MAKAVKKRAPYIAITDDIWNDILRLIEEGETIRSISEMDGMPSWPTIRSFIRSDDKFITQYAQARASAADAYEDRILKEMNNPDPAVARVRIDALKWIMSKRAPKQYGDKITAEHTGPDGAALTPPTLIIKPFTKDEEPDGN